MPHQAVASDGPLSRIGKSLQSGFLEQAITGASAAAQGVDASVIRGRRNQVALQQQELEANQAAADRADRQQALANEAFGGGPDSDRAAAILAFEFPEVFEQISESMGLRTQGQKTQAADFALRLQATPFEERQALINQRVTELSAVGRDPQHTASLSGLSEEEQNNALRVTGLIALTPEQRAAGARGVGTPAEQLAFEALIADFSPEDQVIARRVKARIDPGAVGSSAQTIADKMLADAVSKSEAIIAGATQTAKTEAQIAAELRSAEDVGAAKAREAALVEAALQGERISATRIKTAEEARLLLPEAEAGANEMVILLNEIRNDPDLPNVLGAIEGRIDFRFDEAENTLLAKIAQVTGKTFLQAYQSLKGGGPITDVEGKAATEAQSRLATRTVSVESYQGAIDELIGITDARLARLKRKAAGPQERQSSGQEGGQIMEDAQGNRARVFPDGRIEEL